MSLNIDFEFILKLSTIQKDLFCISGPILIILGIISGILSILVFTRKTLRKNPCTIYLLAFSCANIIYICASFLSPTLTLGYNIRHTAYNLELCRVQLYLAFLFNILCPFYLILASIDRVLFTSSNATTRRYSTRRLAYTLIIIVTLCLALVAIPVGIYAVIIESIVTGSICVPKQNDFSTLVSYASLGKEIIAPLLMIILGLWSIRNIRQMKQKRIVRNTSSITNAKDRQLVRMLFVDISIYILFNTIMPIVLIRNDITKNQLKTFEQKTIDTFLASVAIYSAHIPFCITSYAYLFISKTFQQELKWIILCQ